VHNSILQLEVWGTCTLADKCFCAHNIPCFMDLRLTCSALCDMHNHSSGLRLVLPKRGRRSPAVSHSTPFCTALNWMLGQEVHGLRLVLAKDAVGFRACTCQHVDVPDDHSEVCWAIRELYVRAPVHIVRTLPKEWMISIEEEEFL